MLSHISARTSLRLLVSSVALALVGCSSQNSVVPPVQAAGPAGVKNILLVHGAWADGSSWNPLITSLVGDGYNVTAVQLPLTSLTDDAAALQCALARQTGKTLLVAHSYGGVVISQAGNDPKVAGLVYIAAYAPDAGESVLTLNAQVPATQIMGDLQQDATGFLTLTSAGVAADFAPDLTAAQQTTIAATQGPISAPGAFSATTTQAAWKSVPSWYIISSNDHVISPALEATMAKRMNSTVTTLSSGHLSMLSHTSDVLRVVEEAASSLKS